jgi:hypothetical protein
MRISSEEAALFHKLHAALLYHANKRLKVLRKKFDSPHDLVTQATTEQRAQVRDAVVERPECIDSLAAQNPFGFPAEELELLRSWKHMVSGSFFVLRHLRKYTVFFGGPEPLRAYGVLGLGKELEDVLPPMPLPLMTSGVLLPFRGRIVYDGLLSVQNIRFGAGSRRNLQQECRESEALHGIVTSLPAASSGGKGAQDEAELLRFYLKNESNRERYANEILALIAKDEGLHELFHQEIGKADARRTAKALRERGFTEGWFAVLEGLIVGSGKTRAELERGLEKILPAGKKRFVHVFELKSKRAR